MFNEVASCEAAERGFSEERKEPRYRMVTDKEVRVGEEVARILAGLDDRDEDILRVARSEFAQHGYHASNVDRIAAESGLGKGTIYRRFINKQILFLVTVKSGHTDLAKALTRIGPELPFKERLLARLTAITDYFMSHANIMRLMMHEQSRILEGLAADDFQKLASPLREVQILFWRGLLEEAVEAGCLDKQTDEEMNMLAPMLSGLLRGCYSELFFFSGATPTDKNIIDMWNTRIMEFFFEGIFKKSDKEM